MSWWLVVGGWCGGWFDYAFQLTPTTSHYPPTTVLNKKATDMISRLCSIVESFSVPRAVASEVFAKDL
jgi:hypothetical protein